jgi:hypothetical protein
MQLIANNFEHLQKFQIKLFINLCNIRLIGTNTFFWLIKHVQKFNSIQVYYSLLFKVIELLLFPLTLDYSSDLIEFDESESTIFHNFGNEYKKNIELIIIRILS